MELFCAGFVVGQGITVILLYMGYRWNEENHGE
jgi:hypothetical protein